MAISDDASEASGSIDDVLPALEAAGEYCDDLGEHEAAMHIQRAYRHLKRKQDTLRTRESHVSDVRSP